MFPFCPSPFAPLSIRTFRLLSAFQSILESVSNQLVGLVGGSHGRSELTVLHAWGQWRIHVWGGALQIQPPFWSLSHRFFSQMLRSCVAVPDALHSSSHRTGLAQRISGFRKKRLGGRSKEKELE
ncbi:unnamed protein product [Prunus brigantina]